MDADEAVVVALCVLVTGAVVAAWARRGATDRRRHRGEEQTARPGWPLGADDRGGSDRTVLRFTVADAPEDVLHGLITALVIGGPGGGTPAWSVNERSPRRVVLQRPGRRGTVLAVEVSVTTPDDEVTQGRVRARAPAARDAGPDGRELQLLVSRIADAITDLGGIIHSVPPGR